MRGGSSAGMRPFTRFITQFYDPPVPRDLHAARETPSGSLDTVTFVLAGGAFRRIPLKKRLSLELFFAIVRITRRIRRRQGRAESRLEY